MAYGSVNVPGKLTTDEVGAVTKEYVDNLVGEIAALLDKLNGDTV